MLARIRKSQENNEGGFTLIELLVVIIIIGILAAIAIPTFLKQREKGWLSAAKSDTKNAVTAQESYATEANGSYTTDVATTLKAEGFNQSTDVTTTVFVATVASDGYLVCSSHSKLATKKALFNSVTGKTTTPTACPTAYSAAAA